MQYVLVLDRHDDVSCLMERDRTEGDREARPGSNGWVASAERSEMYRVAAITARPGYRRMYGESTNLSWKPLYLRKTSLSSVMAREDSAV